MLMARWLFVFLCGGGFAYEPCSGCPDPQRFQKVGIGLDLSADYGTASVYFPNGTFVPIAKVEGSSQYKEKLRNLIETAYQRQSDFPILNGRLDRFWKPKLLRVQEMLHPLFPFIPPAPEAQEIVSMLDSLRTAVFAYLGEQLFKQAEAGLTVPTLELSVDRYMFRHALLSAGFTPAAPQWFAWSASEIAVLGESAHSLPFPCHTSDEEPVEYGIVLNFGRSALISTLYSDRPWDQEGLNEKSSFNLGYASQLRKENPKAYWEEVKSQIRSTLDIPEDEIPWSLKKQGVTNIILVGEHSTQEQLGDIVAELLPQGLRGLKREAISKVLGGIDAETTMVDPVFVASIGAAGYARCLILSSGCHSDPTCPSEDSSENEL